MKLTSLRFRLWLTYMLVVGVVITIAAAAIFIYLVRNPAADRSELQRLRLSANLIARRSPVFDELPGQAPTARLELASRRADNWLQARVAIYSANGELLVDSRAGSATALPELSFFTRKRLNSASFFRDLNGGTWLYAVAPLESGNTLIVAAPRPRRTVWNLFREEFLSPFLRALGLALILSVLLAVWISRWISAPLQRLAGAARSVSTSEFLPIPPEGPEEVQDVSRAFNEMGERLQASQRSQRDFIANVSHDLKTPLTSIQGYAQAILDGAADSAPAAQVIYDEAGRMHRMVLDLLDLARLEAGMLKFEKAPLDLGVLLRAVSQKLGLQAQRGQIDLSLDLPRVDGEVPLWVIGDSDRLAQVFANLVDNAIKFTPAGGQVQVKAHPADGWAEIDVADNGPGIPADELERVFERFYQVDKARRGGEQRGVGLGLAIAREIVHAHGGTIRVYNRGTVESGCIFNIRLPLWRQEDKTLAWQKPTTA
jgi:two-component system OmpR family sensor kinase